MIVLDGYCDEIIEGKRYRVQKGDVIHALPDAERVHIFDPESGARLAA